MKYDKPQMEFDNIGWSLTKESVCKCAGNEGFMGVISMLRLSGKPGGKAMKTELIAVPFKGRLSIE